jgi:hypothetical protein
MAFISLNTPLSEAGTSSGHRLRGSSITSLIAEGDARGSGCLVRLRIAIFLILDLCRFSIFAVPEIEPKIRLAYITLIRCFTDFHRLSN